jgi:hypothetical protein
MQKPAKKPAKKRPRKAAQERRSAKISPQSLTTTSNPDEAIDNGSKQSRIVAMLRAPNGATISAMMEATGWQQHSVRGFLAGVVRKKLKLTLHSSKVDGQRVYRIEGNAQPAAANGRPSRRRAA